MLEIVEIGVENFLVFKLNGEQPVKSLALDDLDASGSAVFHIGKHRITEKIKNDESATPRLGSMSTNLPPVYAIWRRDGKTFGEVRS